MNRLQLAVIASGRGSNMQAISDAIAEGRLDAVINVVISDKKEAPVLERARAQGIPAFFIDPKQYQDKAAYEEAMLEVIREHHGQCIVLAGYMRVLSPYFVRNAGLPILNIHPSLLPSFPGLHAQRQAVEAGVRFSGCTVHFVDEGVDTGPIIKQAVVPVYPDDDEDTLAQRILVEEHKLYPQVIQLLSEGKIKRQGRRVIITGEGDNMSKRVLISVSDKTGIVEFAKSLVELGYSVISTGGTAKTLQDAGIPVVKVSDVTGFPEILDGRVKTLHPHIHAGILAKGEKEHLQQLEQLSLQPIDMVVVNLYPFRETIAKPNVTLEEAIENIDIGGPAMVRAAAKNNERVAVVVNPRDYDKIIAQLCEKGELDLATRQALAQEAFAHTAAYDMAISQYLSKVVSPDKFPHTWFCSGEKLQELRYGENPHQKAAFYRLPGDIRGTMAGARQIQGKELSYNNLVDVQAAWAVVSEFTEPAATIIKHTNPCGTALGEELCEAYKKAYSADSISAFGGIIGLNRPVDEQTAAEIAKTFMEAVVAPSFTPEALAILGNKKNLRLLEMGDEKAATQQYWVEPVTGGFLVQEWDEAQVGREQLKVVTNRVPDEKMIEELLFAWKVVKHVKSNAIVVAKDKVTIGVGAGQMNRVGAAAIALDQAKDKARGAVLASDAFFPFPDVVEAAASAGIGAIIQPGGSLRDEDSIKAANEAGISMLFTGMRHFKH